MTRTPPHRTRSTAPTRPLCRVWAEDTPLASLGTASLQTCRSTCRAARQANWVAQCHACEMYWLGRPANTSQAPRHCNPACTTCSRTSSHTRTTHPGNFQWRHNPPTLPIPPPRRARHRPCSAARCFACAPRCPCSPARRTLPTRSKTHTSNCSMPPCSPHTWRPPCPARAPL